MIYYDIDYNDEHIVLECDTEVDAIQWMQEKFAEQCEQSGIEFGESQADVVTMQLNNNDEPFELSRAEFELKYKAESSQLAQHDTRGM